MESVNLIFYDAASHVLNFLMTNKAQSRSIFYNRTFKCILYDHFVDFDAVNSCTTPGQMRPIRHVCTVLAHPVVGS
jgi:hypothetical protein